jgi:hypothetical protein
MRILIIFFLLFNFASFSQDCNSVVKTDSLLLGSNSEKNVAEQISVYIKNNYQISFISFQKKYYLKLTVTDNLGFGKKGLLEIYSGKKQYFERDIKLNSINDKTAYFIFEITQNYTKTISEYGMSELKFNNASFSIPKADSDEIKKAATCFYRLYPQKY